MEYSGFADFKTIHDPHLRVTATEAQVEVEGIRYTAHGTSRASGPDTYNETIGGALSTARALRQIARQIERDARNTVARLDKEREAQTKASAANLVERQANSARIKAELIAKGVIKPPTTVTKTSIWDLVNAGAVSVGADASLDA